MQVQFIERIINVDFDNQRQVPSSFFYGKCRYQIVKVISKGRGNLSPDDFSFVVQTDNAEIYVLDLHICGHSSGGKFYKSFWVLRGRVLQNLIADFLF